MTMDLFPVKETNKGLAYNWLGWRRLRHLLLKWGVDISELRNHNSGEVIPEATCKAIADAIETNLKNENDEVKNWLRLLILKSGGSLEDLGNSNKLLP